MTMHDKNKPKKLLIYIFSFFRMQKKLSRKNFAFQPYKKIWSKLEQWIGGKNFMKIYMTMYEPHIFFISLTMSHIFLYISQWNMEWFGIIYFYYPYYYLFWLKCINILRLHIGCVDFFFSCRVYPWFIM